MFKFILYHIRKQKLEIINEFTSLKEAQINTGINQGNISKCCQGKAKTAGNFIWQFKK